jgi:Asp/Glu/hydantoin racemase
MKPSILLINPNTSTDISATVQALAADQAGSTAEVRTVTAPFGARYISSAAAFVIAGHAVLDAYAQALAQGPRPDAVIVGCFGDPGIDGLREIADVPVLGFAESGIRQALEEPGAMVVATIGAAWRDILEGLARQRGLSERMAGVILIDQWVGDTDAAAREIDNAAHALKADRVVIGGTRLIPMLPAIARRMRTPVIDPHRAAVRDAIAVATSLVPPVKPYAVPAGQYGGLSPALEQMLGRLPASGGANV